MADENRNEEEMGLEDEEYETTSDEEMESEEEVDIADLTDEQRAEVAEAKKTEGNTLYGQKEYLKAIDLYTEAIELCPKCAAYYGNRSAAYVMLRNYDKALQDARSSVEIDAAFLKGHMRLARCYMSIGELSAAMNSYERVIELEPLNTIAKSEKERLKALQMYEQSATESYEKRDYRKVVFCMDRCVEASPGAVKYKILKAECLALIKRYSEAQDIANDLLRMDGTNADAIYVRGMCLYYQDNMDKAYQHFQQVLKYAPDHAKARDIYRKSKKLSQKKEEGNTAFRSGRFKEAYDLYTEALGIDANNIFTNSKLYCNRATVATKLNNLTGAIDDCTKAIDLDETYLKAYLRRAKCYMDSEQYDEAVRDYEKVNKMDKSREHKRLLQDAKLELKKSQRKDYYKLLGISKSANEDEIKKAYRKRAMQHHPDRHSNATDAEKKVQEQKFKEIGEAYTVLSDPKKKARYDSGQDLEDMQGGGGFQDVDPNHIFQAFFGQGGGMGGFPGGMGGMGGGMGGHGYQQQQQFPGGFSFQFG